MATAVSGYLIAHVSGFLSSPAPPPILPAPNAGEVTVNHPAPPSARATTVDSPAAPSLAVQPASPSQPAPPAPPVSAEANESHPAPVQEVATPAKPPTRPTVSAAPARKRGAHDTGTAENKPSEPAEKPRDAAQAKPREPAEKPRDTAETKPHEPAEKPRDTAESKPTGDGKPRDWESVEARVRAALANAAANRPATADAPPRQADVPQPPPAVTVQQPPAVAVQPRTIEAVANAAAARNAASPEPPMATAVPQAPSKPEPLPAVEIKSRPVADVEAVPPTQSAAAPAEAETQGEPTDLVSAIRKLPEILRNDKPVPAGEAPRPPMPVGQ
jgi:hypothetical protein